MKSIDPWVVAVVVLSALLMYCLATEHRRFQSKVIGATAICHSGSISTSPRGQGVCSGHGGVKEWIEK